MKSAVIRGSGWDDYLGSGLSVGRHPSTNPPTFEQIGSSSMFGNHYAVNDQAWDIYHIEHGYKAGTKIYPHFHWEHAGLGNGEDVHFEVIWSTAKGYSQQAYSAETTFTIIATPDATGFTHQIDEASINQAFNSNIEVDSLIKVRFRRITNGGTDFNGKVFISLVDLHVETDGRLTNEKNYPFTKRREL